jgi:hypothetical protein
MGVLNSERARELAQLSAARRRSLRKAARLTLEEVERDLPAMDTPANVQRRVETATNWACAGLIAPGVAQAVVKGGELWHKLRDLELDREHTAKLETAVRKLSADLQRAQARREVSE